MSLGLESFYFWTRGFMETRQGKQNDTDPNGRPLDTDSNGTTLSAISSNAPGTSKNGIPTQEDASPAEARQFAGAFWRI
jgi:hypothetical protein